MTRILRDADLVDPGSLREIVDRIEAGYRVDAEGGVVGIPRARREAGGVTLAWLGASIPSMDLVGFRSYLYRSDGYDRGEQIVALYRATTMELRGLCLGREVGQIRTGAAIAAAIHLVDPGLRTIGLIGTGVQARRALASLGSVLRLDRVLAWSPTPSHREAFRAWSKSTLGLSVDLLASATEVAHDAPALVLTSSSESPVVTRESLGAPKLLVSISGYRRPEIDVTVLDAAPQVWTDSVEQAGAPGTLFEDPRRRAKLRPLGAAVADGSAFSTDAHRIILNTGAAWQEVLVADLLLQRAARMGHGTELPLPAPHNPGVGEAGAPRALDATSWTEAPRPG
ncbi:MAG: hypothetical protein ACREDK_08775 [Thermoplasmata archaeon]